MHFFGGQGLLLFDFFGGRSLLTFFCTLLYFMSAPIRGKIPKVGIQLFGLMVQEFLFYQVPLWVTMKAATLRTRLWIAEGLRCSTPSTTQVDGVTLTVTSWKVLCRLSKAVVSWRALTSLAHECMGVLGTVVMLPFDSLQAPAAGASLPEPVY